MFILQRSKTPSNLDWYKQIYIKNKMIDLTFICIYNDKLGTRLPSFLLTRLIFNSRPVENLRSFEVFRVSREIEECKSLVARLVNRNRLKLHTTVNNFCFILWHIPLKTVLSVRRSGSPSCVSAVFSTVQTTFLCPSLCQLAWCQSLEHLHCSIPLGIINSCSCYSTSLNSSPHTARDWSVGSFCR